MFRLLTGSTLHYGEMQGPLQELPPIGREASFQRRKSPIWRVSSCLGRAYVWAVRSEELGFYRLPVLTAFGCLLEYRFSQADGEHETHHWLTRAAFDPNCTFPLAIFGRIAGRGLIAQLAERVADNDEVPGSSPGGPIYLRRILPGGILPKKDWQMTWDWIAIVAFGALALYVATKGGG